MENSKTLSNGNYINKNRMNLKTISNDLELKITNSHKSHLNLFKFSKRSPKYLKNLSIEEYDLQQNKSLDKYRSGFEEEKIKQNKQNKNKKSIKNQIILKERNEDELNKKLFKNPIQSLNVLTNNNNIYNQINTDSLLRQQILMDKSVKKFEDFSIKFKTKMPKIKISSINSKLIEYIPMINLVENEKKEEELLPPIPESGVFRLFSYFKYPEKNFPEGREQFSICTKGRHILLSGGVCTNMKEMNFWSLNVKNIEWKKLISINKTNNRYGHTTIYDENKVYIYGGRFKEKNKSILVGLEIFNLKDNKYYKPDIQKEPQDRRDHIALYLNDYMLIHGGVNSSNEILSDCHLLNLQNLKWSEPFIDPNSPRPKIYGHTSCLVIPFKLLHHKNFNIYKYPDIENNNSPLEKIKKKGIYIFGGKTKEDTTNDLWILLIGQRPFNWIKPITKGKPPSPRCFHSMDFYEKANYLIIHGGRNDALSASSALNDTFILDLENFEWARIELYSNNRDFKVISRYGHKSTIFSNKLIIFGGMNNNNYIGSSLFIVNLDFYYSVHMKTIEQMNIEKIKGDDKLTQGKKLKKLQIELGKLKLGVVAPVSLPPIK